MKNSDRGGDREGEVERRGEVDSVHQEVVAGTMPSFQEAAAVNQDVANAEFGS